MTQSTQPIDPDIAAIEQAQKTQRLKRIGIAAGIVLLLLFYWLKSYAGVSGSLADDGYTDIKVSIQSPFEFGFEAKKGNSTCTGTVKKLPFSSSVSSFCTSGGLGR